MAWFELFNSTKQHLFDFKKSLEDNFNNLCKIPFFCKPRPASIDLVNLLKACQLNCTETDIQFETDRKKLRKDYATLELAKVGVECWLDKRSRYLDPGDKPSSRVDKVNNLILANILVMQRQLSSRDRLLAENEKIWQHPKLSLVNHLTQNQQLQYNNLYEEHTNAKSNYVKKMQLLKETKLTERSPLLQNSMAIFAPVLNYFNDANFLSYILDGINLSSDLALMF